MYRVTPAKHPDSMTEKTSHCIMHMTHGQWVERHWIYRGRKPQLKQYNNTANDPAQTHEIIKVIGVWSRVDKELGISRNWVDFGRRCTEEELAATPRWCLKLEVANGKDVSDTLANAGESIVNAGGAVGHVVGTGLEAAGLKQPTPPANGATAARIGTWLYGVGDAMTRWWSQKWSRAAEARYHTLHNKIFGRVEAGELLHSASYQKKMKKTGADSKGNQRFDRYVVQCDCAGFDPDLEFKLKYKWSEEAYHLMRVVPKAVSETAKSFAVQLQSARILWMKSVSDADHGRVRDRVHRLNPKICDTSSSDDLVR